MHCWLCDCCSPFDDWKEDNTDHEQESKDNVSKFVAEKFSKQLKNDFCMAPKKIDIAKFWCDERFQSTFPLLYCVAVRIVSIPAISASSKHIFSMTCCIIEKHQTQPSGKSVVFIVYLYMKHHAN